MNSAPRLGYKAKIWMLKEIYDWVMAHTERAFSSVAGRRGWLAWGVALAVLLSLAVSFPRISFLLGNDDQIINFWPVLERQAANPLSMAGDQYKDHSLHDSKLAFRLTLPLTMRVLHIDWRGMLGLQFGLGVLMLALVGKIAMDIFGDRIVALASVFGISSIYAGKAAFLQLGGMGDAFAYALLTVAVAFRNPFVIASAILGAAFTDERGLIVAPFVAIYWAVRRGDYGQPNWFNPQTATVVGAVVFACVIRLVLTFGYGLHIPIGAGKDVGFDVLPRVLPRLQNELPHMLAGLWLWPLVACIVLVRKRWWFSIFAVAVGTATIIGVSFLVLDVERSLAYSLPLLFVAMAVTGWANLEIRDLRAIAIIGFLVSFAFPVNNMLGGVSNRYSEGNLLPIELVRFYKYSTAR